MAVQIDPQTGERIQAQDSVQIDPVTGERITPAPPKAPQPNWDVKASNAIGEGLKGVGEGIANTSQNIGKLEHAVFPQSLRGTSYGKAFENGLDTLGDLAQPKNTAQSIGKGIEQAGEFLLPGGAEEEGAAKLAELAPSLGKIAKPLAKVFTSGVSSGLVNKAQGGSFGSGAALGAGGAGIAEGLKAAAPAIAESALNIRKLDRAFGKKGGSIGRAILDETSGITPGKVAESAQGRLDELNPALNAAADRASVRSAPRIAGFLPPPVEETPLGIHPRNANMHGQLFPAKVNPEEPMEPRSGDVWAPISEYPGINPHYLSGSEHPELSGRIPTDQGVLLRRPEMSASIPRAFEENPSASLSGARGVLSHAFSTAARQGERTTAAQLQPLATHLGEDIGGNAIPENVTPRQLLDLKRGFGSEFIHRWNPETMTGVKGTAAKAYHAMGNEFNRTVPEGAELNRRISNLIPVAKRAESAELNAPTSQRVLGRFAAHTGALAGGIGAGAYGYHQGGVPGMLAAGALGTIAPELLASPEGQMAIARTLNSRAPKVLSKVFTGAELTGIRQNRQTTGQ